MKFIRNALLTLAIFLGSLAAVGAQSAGPGEKWYGHITVKVNARQSALMTLKESFDERAECHAQLMVGMMQLGANGADVTNGWCSPQTFEETMEELKKAAGRDA